MSPYGFTRGSVARRNGGGDDRFPAATCARGARAAPRIPYPADLARDACRGDAPRDVTVDPARCRDRGAVSGHDGPAARRGGRSEEHTSELQSLMRISYAVFCLKKQKQHKQIMTRAIIE